MIHVVFKLHILPW